MLFWPRFALLAFPGLFDGSVDGNECDMFDWSHLISQWLHLWTSTVALSLPRRATRNSSIEEKWQPSNLLRGCGDVAHRISYWIDWRHLMICDPCWRYALNLSAARSFRLLTRVLFNRALNRAQPSLVLTARSRRAARQGRPTLRL